MLAMGLLITLPFYMVRYRKYGPTIRERLGFVQPVAGTGAVWIHAVSVGEVRAVEPLLGQVRVLFGDRPIVLSTTTPTGQTLARSRSDVDRVIYFPIDLPGPVRRVLDRVRPSVVIMAETEIWPNFLRAAAARNVPVFMVNGRISDKSYRRYRMAGRWLEPVLGHYRLLGMQTPADADRIRNLGAPPDRVQVLGNVKYDAPPVDEPDDLLARELGNGRLLIAASTAADEEPLVLAAFQSLLGAHPDLRLLIAPRRTERFSEVGRMIEATGLEWARRSTLSPESHRSPWSVMLLDSIGELSGVFRFATVVFMGGTLVPRGGHNILEPARFAKPVVFGPHMENFRQMAATFLTADAAVQVAGPDELVRKLDALLKAPERADTLGANALSVAEQNAGATERTLEAIADTMGRSPAREPVRTA